MPIPALLGAAVPSIISLFGGLFGKKKNASPQASAGGGGGGNLLSTLAGMLGGGGKQPSFGQTLLQGLASAIPQAGMGLLAGAMSGKEKAADRKYKEQNAMKYLKPNLPRYNIEKDLGSIDPALKKIMIGRLGDVLGPEKLGKYGVNLQDLLGSIGGGSASSAATNQPAQAGSFAGRSIPSSYADSIQKKYGIANPSGGGYGGY